MHHGDYANLVAVAGRLHNVLVAVGGKRKHQTALAEDVVVLVLVPSLGAAVAPVLKVLTVPDDRVPIRAVRALDREQADREVLPDGLAQVDVGHHPAGHDVSITVVNARDEHDLLLGLRRIGGQPHLRQVKPTNLVTVHRGHDGVSHKVDDGEVLNGNGHLEGRKGRKGKEGKEGRKAGRLEGRAACEAH